MVDRLRQSSRFQAFAPGIGLFLVLLGALITAAGVTWMRGGEAAAQPGPDFTISKTNGSQVAQSVEWVVVITNNNQTSQVVEFIDNYGGEAGTVIEGYSFSGDEEELCDESPSTLGCILLFWPNSTAQFTIRTSLPVAECHAITLTNDALLYLSDFGLAAEELRTIQEQQEPAEVLVSDTGNTYVVPGNPSLCPETPVTSTPETPSPTVCVKCSTPPPTFPPGLISTPIPTATPVPPTNTPVPVGTQSGGLTDEQRTQTAVAGAKTAAAAITPLPPRTGDRSQGGAQTGALNITLVVGGLVILAAGLGVLGTRSRKAR